MDFYIKKQDAIEAVENTTWYHQNRLGEMVEGANDAEHQAWYKADEIHSAIENIPPADTPSRLIAKICIDPEEFVEKMKTIGIQVNDLSAEPKRAMNIAKDYADCDQFVCSWCGIELRDWTRVEIDDDDGEEFHYEYVFRYCPNCGAEIKDLP